MWWQHEHFPKVWTSEGLTTCMENGYQWNINSTTWNHLRMMWQAQPLDLLRLIHAETHHQNNLEASGYRSPTWRVLRALQSIINANVVIGESTITAAPFFEGAGRPSRSFWGPQQGRKVILWESLSQDDQQCLVELRDDTTWALHQITQVQFGVRPNRKTWLHKHSESTEGASSKANVRRQSKLMTIEKKSREAGMLSEPEVGGNGEM